MEQIEALLEKHKHQVFFFSRQDCTYCDVLADELTDLAIPFEKVQLDSQELVALAKEKTGLSSFPMLYFGTRQIGGFREFTRLVTCNATLQEALDPLGISVEIEF